MWEYTMARKQLIIAQSYLMVNAVNGGTTGLTHLGPSLVVVGETC